MKQQSKQTEQQGNLHQTPLLPIDMERLLNVFAWLIKEDKKQNPSLYIITKEKHDD